MRIKYMTNKECIFCKIINGEIKSNMISETDLAVAIEDINPVAETHILIVPKKHIDSVLTINESDSSYLIDMHKVAGEIAKKNKLDSFRLAFNGGKFQHVPHLHMHFLAGRKIEWSKL